VSIYADTDEFYAATRALFIRIEQEDPHAGDAILSTHLVMRLRSTAPDAEITINGRRRPIQITYGPDSVRPTLDIELPADLLHRILLGEQSMKKALASGELKVSGPVWKATALEDLFRQSQSLYPRVLRERNLLPGD
jgi:hypothetical protein